MACVNVSLEYIHTFGFADKVFTFSIKTHFMLIKIKYLPVIILVAGIFVSCNTNPNDLAKAYCNCRAEIEKGQKSETDCASMAESHTLKLQDEPEALKTYTSEILDCITSTEIVKEK